MNNRSNPPVRYIVVSASENIHLKLFIGENTAKNFLPSTPHGWSNVQYQFKPPGNNLPKEIRFVFKNHLDLTIDACLPTSDNDVAELIQTNSTFVLSMTRSDKLNYFISLSLAIKVIIY